MGDLPWPVSGRARLGTRVSSSPTMFLSRISGQPHPNIYLPMPVSEGLGQAERAAGTLSVSFWGFKGPFGLFLGGTDSTET